MPFCFDCVYTLAHGSALVSARALTKEGAARKGSVISKRLIDSPGEQASLRAMASRRASGWTQERIASHLDGLGVKPRLGSPRQAGNLDGCLHSRHTAKILSRLTGTAAAT